ncbi:hypothetical protein [Thiofilum flexile]|uniref:hypothetical protein n=1 Tax=Thiofilum flexile TaxID=125627 RepID=UPI000364C05F|nr:hypothetical protein [Thiofilum flexile]
MSNTDMTQQSERVALQLRYQSPSEAHADHVQLIGQLNRSDVKLEATLQEPLIFRETMAALFAIVSSDYRYAPKDRQAYAAFMQMRRAHQNQGLAKAQRAYFDWLLKNDPLGFCILDPIISVYPNGVVFEVFSKDEGSYAMLSFDYKHFNLQGTPVYGTTNIDFSDSLAQGLEQMRSFKASTLSIGQTAVGLDTVSSTAQPDSTVLEKQVQVPNSWIRGFLQVQASAQLPTDKITLNPLDVYNLLHHLRMHADIKGKRRGLRLELIPGRYPSIILEPNDVVLDTQTEVYKGKQAKIIRLWGRRRLNLLKRILPFTETIEVGLLGNGMPSFWTMHGKGWHLTLAITGFTAANWSQALNFDLLLPRDLNHMEKVTPLLKVLEQQWVLSLEELVKQTGLNRAECRSALLQACQQGLVMYDVGANVYRYRPLTVEPLDMSHFQFRQPAEKLAYDLVHRQKALSQWQTLLLPGEGVEIAATITVKEDKRDYLAKLKLNEEGQVVKAECSCHQIMQHGLTQGPCSHLIALRIAYALRQAERNVATISQETRAFSRRKASQVEQIQLTLNEQRVFFTHEQAAKIRRQQMAFNSVNAARHAYLDKIQQLEASGFIDSTLG